MNAIPEPDSTLLKEAQNGDCDAFNEIAKTLCEPVYRLCLSLLHNPALAEDAAQDALVKAFASLESFKWKSRFSTWIYRITCNRCLDILRKRSTHKEDSLDYILDEKGGIGLPSFGDNTENLSDSLMIKKALAALPQEHQAIIALREIAGLSYDEIAEALGIPEGTVKSKLFRAREFLQEQLAPHVAISAGGTFTGDTASNNIGERTLSTAYDKRN